MTKINESLLRISKYLEEKHISILPNIVINVNLETFWNLNN